MIRQFSRVFLRKTELKNAKRYLCRVPPNSSEYFEDSLLPKYSKEGIPMRDPRDINDPDFDKPVGNVQSENFTFDFKQGIGQVCLIFLLVSPISKTKGFTYRQVCLWELSSSQKLLILKS